MTQLSTAIRIPTPCSETWAAMTPSDTGRRCATCETDIVDFTRMPQAEAIDSLTAYKGQRVCARVVTLVVPTHPKRLKGPRRWLVTVAAFLGWQLASALLSNKVCSQPLPQRESVIIRGVVLDDSLNVPVPGLWLYLNHTKYGAITNERGEFTLTFPAEWKPVRGGAILLQATPIPFTFKAKQVQLDWRSYDSTRILTLRLASAPGRGRSNLKGFILKPPPVPPPVYPASSHTARH